LQAAEADRSAGPHVFNEYLYGGFLIYYTPRFQVFVDDRCELYGDAWLLDFVSVEWHDTGPGLRSLQEGRGRFDLALTRTGSGYDRHFRHAPGWRLVRKTATATLYRRALAADPASAGAK
jgi:hypothetical protein